MFGEGFGKATEAPANGNAADDSDGAYKNEEEPPSIKLEDQQVSKSPFTKIFERDVQKFKQITPIDKKRNMGVGKASI